MAAAPRPRPSLSWEVLDTGALARHAGEWDRLVTDGGYPAFMQSRYLGHALRTFQCDRGCLVIGRNEERVLAAGILSPVAPGQWVTYQPSQLPLGAWAMSRDCGWHDALPPLIRVLPGYAMSLGVMQQDPRLVPRPAAEAYCEALDYVPTAWIDVAGSFEEYWLARGKNLRQNVRKSWRRLEEQGGRLEFEFVDHPDDVDAAFLEFAALESAGWKAKGGTAISAGSRQGAFYRDVLRDFAIHDAGFAVRLTVGGRPIAVDFGVRDADTLVLLKTTYDERLKAYSPAQLLHERAFEYIFRHGLARRIEFYGRLMEWHARWTEKSRMLFHVNFYRARWMRVARDLVKRTRDRAQAARSPLAGR